MKKVLCCLLLTGLIVLQGASVPRQVEISGKKQKITSAEIVLEKPIPLLRYAAQELQSFLKQAAALDVKIVQTPTGKNALSIILGNSSHTGKAGLDVNKLPREGYYIVRKGNKLYLSGQDDPGFTPTMNNWKQLYRRGSLSAVYDFLERFCAVRYYFPGVGTVIPRKDALYLPEKIFILERPDMSRRDYYVGRTNYYPGYPVNYKGSRGVVNGDNLTRTRLRFSEIGLPGGHSLNYLQYVRRFGKTHPEYFALRKEDGKRYCLPGMPHTGQLCYSGPLREIIYQDAKAVFTKQDPKTRGLDRWHSFLCREGYVALTPQDWFYWCGCEKCRTVAEPGRGKIYSDRAHRQRVSTFMWKFWSEIANRFKKERLKAKLKQSIYPPYDLIPDCDIPDNVDLHACVNAVGGDKADTAFLKKWSEKIGNRKLGLWTYSIGKHMSKKIPGIIPMYPRNIARFLDDNRKYITGAFYEAESDYFLFQYLNFYVLAKKTWDNSVSVDALLNEHHRIMFGKGAPYLKKFYDSLEEKWAKRILGNTVDSGLGPTTRVPRDYQIWNEIFSPAVIAEYDALFDKALQAASKDPEAIKRIRFIRTHFYGPLKKASEKFSSGRNALKDLVVSCPGTVFLRATKGDVTKVSTKVSLQRDEKNLYVTFRCEEPRMKDMICKGKKRDYKFLYDDSSVEILLNPSGDRKTYYQFIVNPEGVMADYRWSSRKKADISWNSSATAKTVKKASSWEVFVTIPLKDLGKEIRDTFPVNFCRSRNLAGRKSGEQEGFFWNYMSDVRNAYHSIENWGVMQFKSSGQKKNRILSVDFTGKLSWCYFSGGAKSGQICKQDDKIFLSGGKSLYFKNIENLRMGLVYCMNDLKPATKYRVSVYLRTKDLHWSKGTAAAYIGINVKGMKSITFPRGHVSGTTAWHRLEQDFVTPAVIAPGKVNFISCSIYKAGGEAWFDNLTVEKVPAAK